MTAHPHICCLNQSYPIFQFLLSSFAFLENTVYCIWLMNCTTFKILSNLSTILMQFWLLEQVIKEQRHHMLWSMKNWHPWKHSCKDLACLLSICCPIKKCQIKKVFGCCFSNFSMKGKNKLAMYLASFLPPVSKYFVQSIISRHAAGIWTLEQDIQKWHLLDYCAITKEPHTVHIGFLFQEIHILFHVCIEVHVKQSSSYLILAWCLEFSCYILCKNEHSAKLLITCQAKGEAMRVNEICACHGKLTICRCPTSCTPQCHLHTPQ